LREHAVAYLQIDQPGCVGATRWNSASNLELKSMQQAIDAAHLGRRPRGWRRSIKIGDASFFGLGVPMLSGIAAFTESELKANGNAIFGWWHHTDKNTLDKVDWDDLAFHLRIYASYVWTVCTAPVLPFDFVLLVEAVLQRLREIADRDGVIGLDKTIARGEALRQHALRLEAAVKTFNATAAAQGSFDDAKARRLDRTIKRLSRLLLPIESTASDPYGHDPYGFTPQSTVLPGLYDMPLLADPALDTAQRRMLETELVRARNRITDALDDCCALIDAALEA
jgi:hypothetical protein